jgi:hypothetical protein
MLALYARPNYNSSNESVRLTAAVMNGTSG